MARRARSLRLPLLSVLSLGMLLPDTLNDPWVLSSTAAGRTALRLSIQRAEHVPSLERGSRRLPHTRGWCTSLFPVDAPLRARTTLTRLAALHRRQRGNPLGEGGWQ